MDAFVAIYSFVGLRKQQAWRRNKFLEKTLLSVYMAKTTKLA